MTIAKVRSLLLGHDQSSKPGRGRALTAGLLLVVTAAALTSGAWTAYRLVSRPAAHTAAPAAATEQRKLLVLRTYFANYPATSRYSTSEVNAHMSSMNDLWVQTSYDNAELDYAVTALFQVPGDDTDYVDWDDVQSTGTQFIQIVQDAVAAAPAGTDFEDLNGILVVMAETDPDKWHRGRAGTVSLPLGEDGADVGVKSAIVLENPTDADDKVWGRWMHEVGHVFQVVGPAHPSAYDSAFEIMDGHYPGHTGVFNKLASRGFPGWLPGWKYVSFTPHPSIGPAAAGLGGGMASLWAIEYDPADKPNPQAVQAFVTDSVYYLVSMRRRVLGDDINTSFSPPGIPDEGVLIERVVEGGDPDSEDRWVTLQPPPGGDINDLWKCGQTFTNDGDGVEIAIGREVVREVVLGAVTDAWIREGDAVNHGAADELYVGNLNSPEGGFDGRFRSLVRFDLSALPADAKIESATLRLRHQGVSGNQTVTVAIRKANSAWSENTVTWANQPTAGFIQNGNAAVGHDAGPVEWDVAWTVGSWHGGFPNYGFLLRAVDENANVVPRKFFSREHLVLGLGGASSFKPTLRIVYTQVCPPEDNDPDQQYVRVSYDPGANQPDIHISPWRTAPLDAWESTDVWIDSPVNGFGTYRAGTWTTPWGDDVPYWNGDEPTVGSANRVVARVRNVGTQNATNVVVHFDITDPPGLGISGADGFKLLGTVDSGDFPGLGLIPPGGYTDVWVMYEPHIYLGAQEIEDGYFAFHTCFRVRVDPVPGETILGNQDGDEEQENVFWYEVPVGDEDAEPPRPFSGSIHVKNFDPARSREYLLYADQDLPAGWSAEINDGEQALILGPAEAVDVPVVLVPPDPLPAIGSTARLDVAAGYLRVLTNDLFEGHEREHNELTDLGGVSVVGGVVAETHTSCTAHRVAGGIEVSGLLSAARGEPVRHTKVYVRADGSPHTGLASVAPDGSFSTVIEDPAGATTHVDCLFGGTLRLGRSADAAVPVPPAPVAGRPTPATPDAVQVAIAPERAVLAAGDIITETIFLTTLPRAALERVAFTLHYNPSIVRVVDADPRMPGVQALPGAALAGYTVAVNAADNRAGTLELSAARAGARTAPARSLLLIRFEAVAVGSARLTLQDVALATAAGPLQVVLRDGSVRVTDDPRQVAFRMGGHVKVFDGLMGAHGATRVCGPAGCTATDPDGAYQLGGVHVGDEFWTERPGFLTERWTVNHAPRQAGGLLEWPEVVLVPGDIDGDGVVGLSDGVGVLGAVGSSRMDRRFLPARDLNRDQVINAADVALVVQHWGAQAQTAGRDPRGGRVAFDSVQPAALPARLPRRTFGAMLGTLAQDDDAAATPMLRVLPARSSVAVGELVTVEVRAEGVEGLFGAALELHFDPTLLAVVDADLTAAGVQVEPGALFPPRLRTVLLNDVEVLAGKATYAAGLTGAVPGVNGDGVLARIVLQALAPGGTDLRVLRAELRDDAYPDSTLIPVAIGNGTVDVRPVAPDEPTVVATPEPRTPQATAGAPTEPPTRTPTAVESTPTATPTLVGPPTTEPVATPLPTNDGATPPATTDVGRIWLPWALRLQ